jgi:mannitol-1-phosphate 5-dehydrogenase
MHKKILIFGAGKIGRAFIGQLFGLAEYEVVFVDAIREITILLSCYGEYRVEIRDDFQETLLIRNVRGIHISEKQKILHEIVDTDLIATSVGIKALPFIAPLIAEGLEMKSRLYPDSNTDIIIAENLRDATEYFTKLLQGFRLPESILHNVGLIESSIGKMVPIMTEEKMAPDPLLVFAEAYNTLILDARGFKNAIPDIQGIAAKENIKAWVDRKLFIHNLGHAAAAYFGNFLHPELQYMYEVLADEEVAFFTSEAMKESGTILRAIYPDEFSSEDIADHAADLIKRFQNRLLGDTVYRVGTDLLRKLGKTDRLAVPMRFGIRFQLPFRYIFAAYQAALHFKATLDNNLNPNDLEVTEMFRQKGISHVLSRVSGLDPEQCFKEDFDFKFNFK